MDQPSEDESLDSLNADWKIFQLKKGHRFSTDDLVTAWRASLAAPNATRLLDMGCGLGSVGLSTLYRQPKDATLVGIEAQEMSIALARRTMTYNGLDDRVTLHFGDLRDSNVLPKGSQFDLITGSPPYIPSDKGVHSPHPQRAACRMELRGSVIDYCKAARQWLAPGGIFAFVMVAADPRTEDAPRLAGLQTIERWDYVFARNRAPLIATLVCMREEDNPPKRTTGQLVIRGADGEWTDEYMAFRNEMGNPMGNR